MRPEASTAVDTVIIPVRAVIVLLGVWTATARSMSIDLCGC